MTWTPTGIPFSSFPSEGCLQKKQSTHKPEKKGKLETEHLMYLLLVFSLGVFFFPVEVVEQKEREKHRERNGEREREKRK